MRLPRKTAALALQWYLDHGVDEVLVDAPVDRRAALVAAAPVSAAPQPLPPAVQESTPAIGKSEARDAAVKLAKAAGNLEELRAAIAAFDGIAIKKTATNLVFSDGHAQASIMVIGEAPGADEDRQGFPFVGVSGQLLDKIFACIDLSRRAEDPAQALYISNILNWRPPGNRTPSPAEIDVSLPFIERHIQLVQPKLLVLCGAVSAQALLGTSESISKLRKRWHDYTPQTSELDQGAKPIPTLATYHPSYLLRTPAQKKAVWADMLVLAQKRRELGLI